MYIHKNTPRIVLKYPEEYFKTSWLLDVKKLFSDVVERCKIIDKDFYMFTNSCIITHMFIAEMERVGWYNMKEFMYYESGVVYIIDIDCNILNKFKIDLNIDFEQETVKFLLELKEVIESC